MQDKKILDQISCTLSAGVITTFIGLSGAGKTTLLKTMSGLYTPSQGDILIDGIDLQSWAYSVRSQTIGYVFQDFNLFGHINVLQLHLYRHHRL